MVDALRDLIIKLLENSQAKTADAFNELYAAAVLQVLGVPSVGRLSSGAGVCIYRVRVRAGLFALLNDAPADLGSLERVLGNPIEIEDTRYPLVDTLMQLLASCFAGPR